jgi:hypothetical protein
MKARKSPGGRLLPGLIAACAATACGLQFLLERLEGDAALDARAFGLLAAALVGAAVVVLTGLAYRRSSSARDLKRRLALDLRDLPFAGRGTGFFGLVLAVSFGCAAFAHAGEDALGRGDLLAWAIAACTVSFVAAIAAWFAVRTLPAIAVAFAAAFVGPPPPVRRIAGVRDAGARIECRDAWPPKLFNRPPPLQIA